MFTALKDRVQEKATPLFSAAQTPVNERQKRWLRDRIDKSKKGVFTETVELTPCLAEMLLSPEFNPDNRSINWANVKKWAEAISRGEWEFNGETLKLSRDATLNDGQHRCLAVVQAGRPITVLFVFGLERETRHSVDVGGVRTLAHIFQMKKIKNAAATAAATRMLWLYENRLLPAVASPTHSQAEDVLKQNPGLIDSFSPAARVYSALRGSKGTWQFTHYACSLVDRDLADRIYGQLATGLNYDRGRRDPVYLLREHLRGDNKPFLNTWQQAALALRLWNMKRGFEKPALPAYDAKEEFPIAR